jgi:NADH:ubiquinone oxidoreductase subunit 6 (subunit J)
MEQQQNRFISLNTIAAFILSALFLVVMLNVIFKADIAGLAWVKAAKRYGQYYPGEPIGINNIGINLMTSYLLPFEAISILLMIALVGAAHLSRKEGNP